MSDTKGEVHHTDAAAVEKTPKRRKCMGHCKRFWWAYLIAFLCAVVLIVCLVIFVGVPNIAQDKMNDAKLDIQGVHVLDTEPDSYLMEINSTIRTDGSIHAKIDPFVGYLYLDGEDKSFARLDFPETNADKYQEVNVSQPVKISDMDAFKKFNIEFVQKEKLTLHINGETKAEPRGLSRKYDVDFKKTLEIKGLNMFKGTTIDSDNAKLELKKDKEGKNFYGEATIPNPSHFTLDIGNVEFQNYVDDEKVGVLFIEGLLLHPGDNKVNVTADMEQIKVLNLVSSDKYCKSGIIPFKLQGLSVKNSNNDTLEYFQEALASGNQTVEIDIKTIIKNNLGNEIKCGGGD